jgi:prefoldin subunit 5
MKRWAFFAAGIWILAIRGGTAEEEIRLSDQDLEAFEDEAVPNEAEATSPGDARWMEREAVSERYDGIIDQLQQELRQIRNVIREVPPEIEALRRRLALLEAGEEPLRREDFSAIWSTYPYLRFEDFDEAIERALERRERREGIRAEIEQKEAELAAMEAERASLLKDLNAALELREAELSGIR